jgi:DNA adenine methylase
MNSIESGLEVVRPLSPLLRWAGGKRWLAPHVRRVADLVQPTMYIEPFVGGGAVFLSGAWPRPILGDLNSALVECYRGLAQDPALVRKKLKSLQVNAETYDRVSRWRPSSSTGAAARLIYLNRTAYGGIYRENRAGKYNVPFAGDRNLSSVLIGDRLEQIGASFATASLVSGDFEALLSAAIPGAFVYCDPPYSLEGAEVGFRRYGSVTFAWEDQARLAASTRALVERGVCVLVSNSDHEMVRALYANVPMLPVVRKSTLARGGPTEQKEAVYVLHPDCATAERILSLLAEELA